MAETPTWRWTHVVKKASVKVIRTRLELSRFLARFPPLDFAVVKGAK